MCVLPAANPKQMRPSKSRAAIREAMSPFLCQCELGLAAFESLSWGTAARRELSLYLYWEKVKVNTDWKSGKLGTRLARALPCHLPLQTSGLLCLAKKILRCVLWISWMKHIIRLTVIYTNNTFTVHGRESCRWATVWQVFEVEACYYLCQNQK